MTKQISSILVANRGEIARRVFATARRLGLRTVAVFSDADAGAAHVQDADVAIHIGPSAARESYLVSEKIIAAAREAGADAIHPGYGFLSENAEFAEMVVQAGLTWIGPPPSAIRAMGLKDAAKAIISKAGVPVTPGYLGQDQSPERLQSEADKIGYPLLIKAVAGGGGRGMRKVEQARDFAAALQSCRREAIESFGDDRVLLETYVSRPRHIEVQIFGDQHGRVVHLFERDCSLQRRHQKVIEEAPAPGMSEETRAAITDAAVRAAKAVDYVGAGTVEFIADGSEGPRADRIWFMEMNTRLQVEHPVTEKVTGVDLVEWQIRVARGEALPLAQHDIRLQGHAVEARLYAENPASGFLPSIGRLDRFRMPDGIRIDAGVREGDKVSPFYDPMIAKLVIHADAREAAIAGLAAACEAVQVWPVNTNAGFLARCLKSREFMVGQLDTGFIERSVQSLASRPDPSPAACSAAAQAAIRRPGAGQDPWTSLFGFRTNAAPAADVRLFVDGKAMLCAINIGAPLPSAIVTNDREIVVFEGGEAIVFTAHPPITAALAAGGDGAIRAPMPGKITQLFVEIGDAVAKGQALVVLEAMKMEHTLLAPFEGRVEALSASVASQVTEGALLVKLSPR